MTFQLCVHIKTFKRTYKAQSSKRLIVSGFEFKAPRNSFVPSITDANRVSRNNATKLELRVTRWAGWTCSTALCFVWLPTPPVCTGANLLRNPCKNEPSPNQYSLHEQFSATVLCVGCLNHVLPSTAHQDQLVLVRSELLTAVTMKNYYLVRCRVGWYKFTDVSEKRTTSIFITFLRNAVS